MVTSSAYNGHNNYQYFQQRVVPTSVSVRASPPTTTMSGVSSVAILAALAENNRRPNGVNQIAPTTPSPPHIRLNQIGHVAGAFGHPNQPTGFEHLHAAWPQFANTPIRAGVAAAALGYFPGFGSSAFPGQAGDLSPATFAHLASLLGTSSGQQQQYQQHLLLLQQQQMLHHSGLQNPSGAELHPPQRSISQPAGGSQSVSPHDVTQQALSASASPRSESSSSEPLSLVNRNGTPSAFRRTNSSGRNN